MHAYQPQRQTQRPTPPRKKVRRQPQQRQAQQSRRNRAVLIELSLQTTVNCALVGVAIAAIANLLPHHMSQQERIAEIRTEVAEAEYRVNQLREDFNGNFDAYESQDLIREHSDKVDLLEKRIIWVEPDSEPIQN
ncbi:hypothetical protein Lepto7376_4411 [[Leptolyngbya] sp. PCC 7376]|uniref:slr1601 family putative cell division protein n=1 Tax=[Leptolyngbya] sp. PCC 7376 TaxID=111781 RepID=UPI00029EC831|nr:hypothetical protein [[Leptolyngbya] sp. PCC 7376]AFY40519.1 hypothetical protein Lepto7376_4411 [[Leptolyngbya] sp. PCC 7376]